MADFYQEIDQKLFMVDEQSYGYAYDPETDSAIWTKLAAAFPHVIPINIITDSFDYEIPRRLKEKIYAIGGGKHPAMVVDTVQDPVDISLETKLQNPLFMAYAIGDSTSTATGAVKEITEITFATVTDSSAQGKYFLMNGIDANGEEHWAFWLSTSGDTGKPTIAGIATANIYAINISGVSDPTNPTGTEIGQAFITAADAADAYFGTPTGAAAIITVSGQTAGAVRDCRDSGVDPIGLTASVTTQGSSTHTITESTGYELPSFTFHIEQVNIISGDNIIIDLFGCIVTSCEITVDFSDKIVSEAVTFRSPHYAEGDLLTNPPPFIEAIEPYIWGALTEAASNYLLQEGTTDKTPTIVSKASFKIDNEVDFHPGIGVNYATFAVNKKREVSLNIVGFIQDKDLLEYFLNTWDTTNEVYTGKSKLNTVFKLVRTATNDQFEIHIYNWIIEDHNNHIFNIDEGIKAIDLTLTGATPYTDKRLIVTIAGAVGFTIASYLSDTCFNNGTWT
ncbi:hypothetical protein LCGC14_1343570 [marine sediment metagenome]|uniref:Uncharacterized protein n=1 Tax=marine sediment metagenome TaxID=412755 RepID=A0A0F9NFD1_9ZZZZ